MPSLNSNSPHYNIKKLQAQLFDFLVKIIGGCYDLNIVPMIYGNSII